MPPTLVDDVKEAAAKKGISTFIADAVRNEIARRKRASALEKFEKLPDAFPEITDSVAYVNGLRAESEERLQRFGL